ncbi:MAG: hypothetical protein ACI4PZ_04595 [Akkermansia sp.]
MKLHLPSRLRAALLSCMAFVSPMLPTLCSGTLLASAVVWSTLSPAYAAWNEGKTVYTYTSEDQTAAKSFSAIAAEATEGSNYTIAFAEGVTYTLTGSINLVTSSEEGSAITGGSLQMTDWGDACKNATLAGNGDLTVNQLTFGRGTSTIQGTSAEDKVRLNVLGSAGCNSWYDTKINVSNAVLNLQQGITLVTGYSSVASWAARMTMRDTDVILGAAMVTQTVNDTITFNGNCSIDVAGLQTTTYSEAFPDSDVERPESNGFATSRSGYRILGGTSRGILGESATLTVKNGETVLATYSNGADIATALKFVTTDDMPIITSTVYCVTDIKQFSWDAVESATKIVFFDSQVSETSNVYDLGGDVHAVSMEIRDGVTFTTSHNGGTAFWGNGNTFTIKGGATLITTANDAIGYNNASTRLVMQGEEGKEALWQLGRRVTTTSRVELNGNARIVAPEGADLGASGGGDRSGLDLHGGTIAVTGLNNVIETNVFTRSDGGTSTLDIAEGGELTLKYGITSRSGNKPINKSGSGTLIVEGTVAQTGGTLNLTAGSVVYRNATVSQGTLSMGANTKLIFEARDTLTEHTLTTLSTTGGGGLISIGAGNSITSGSLNISWAKNLAVDGVLSIDGNDEGGLTLAYANVGTVSGRGSLSTNRLIIDNSTRLDWKLGAVSSVGTLTMGGTGENFGTNNSLTLQSAMTVSGNATLTNGVLTANAALSIGGDLSVLGAATLVSTDGVSVTGSSTLTSGATLGTSISAGQSSITYSDGANGFLTGGKAYIIKGSSISVVNGEGAEAELSTLHFTLDGLAVEDATRAGTDDTGLYLTIEAAPNALYYVNSGSVTMNDHSTATGFVLAEGATLVCKASAAADYASTEGLQSIRSLGGQLNVVNSEETNLLTLEGAYSGVTLNSKLDSSIQVLGGTVASGSTAALTVHSGATLDLNNDGLVRGAAITVESGATVSVNGNQRYQGNMLLQGTLVLGRTDALDWGSSGKLTIDGGTVEAGSTRISIDSNNLELRNATINGAGEAVNGVLDFASGAQKVVVATGTNTVEGMVRVRGNGGVCFDVQGQSDTLSLKNLGLANQTTGLTKGTILTKSGLGTLTVNEASALATVEVQGGTLKLTGTNDITSTTVAGGATLGSTAAGLTLGGALTLQDGAKLDVTNGAIALGATDSKQALTWNGDITLVGADTRSVDLLSGISSITGIDFGSGDTVAAADYIQGASENALLRFTNGTLTFLSSDDSILVVSNAHTYDQADADNTAVTSIRLAGGTLSMANVAIPSAVTTLDVTAAGGALTGTGTVNTLSFGSVNVNGQLTLQDGATDLTLKTQQLSIGENGSIVLEAGQTLDLTELTPGGAANSGFTRATDALKLTLGKVTGAGSVKLCGATTSIGDDNRIMTRMLSDTATSVAYLSEGALAVNGSGSSVALNIGSSFTVGGEFRLESGAQIKVTTGGALSVNGSINMGHADVANNNGSLSMSDGSITTDGIGFTRTNDHGTGSSFTMSGGTLTINTTAGIASGIGITITGGTLATNGADWGMSNATIGGAAISGTNTISLSGSTTLTGTLDNRNGKLALSGSVNISDTDAFQTQSTTTGYSDGAKQGFASQDVNYTIAKDGSTEHLSIADGTTWTVNGEETGSLVDLNGSKVYRVTGVQGTAFHIGTNDVTYSTIKERTNSAGQGITELVLCGKGLNLDDSLANGVTVRLDAASSVIALSSGVSLNKASVTGGDAAHALDLRGSGTYALGSDTGLGEGVSLNATEWTGTVSMDSCAGGDLSALGNANSTIAVTGALSGTSVTTASALSVGGSAALTSGASSAKSFNGTDLTLGTATETATLSTTGALSLSGSLTLASVGSSVNVGSVGGTALALDINNALAGDAGSIANWTLMTLGTASDLVTLAGGTATDTGFELRGGKDNLYLYTLEWQANGTQLVLTGSTLYGKVWGGKTGDEFDNGNTWDDTTTDENTDVIFAGDGSGTVAVDGDVSVKNITISGRPSDNENYEFTGDSINASGSLTVIAGSGLSIENATQVEQGGSIGDGGSLSIGDGGSLSVQGDLSNEGSLSIDNGGSLSVQGGLSNEGSLSIAQGGSIALGDNATLKTDSITITKLDSAQGALVQGGKLASLTPGADITLSLSDDLLTTVLDDADVEHSQSYVLVNVAELAAHLKMHETQMQAILKSGRLAEISGATTFALRAAASPTTLNLILRQQTANESTWVIGEETTRAGLVVTDGGKLVSGDILDNVQHVVVNGEQVIDLRGQDASGAALTQLKLNGVRGVGSLALKGDATDVITITTTDNYTGSLSAEGLKLVMNTGAHTTVELGTGTLTLDGASSMTGGVLAATLDQAQIETGAITLVSGAALALDGTKVVLGTTASALNLDPDAKLTVKLGETGSTATDVTAQLLGTLGKYFGNATVVNGELKAERNRSYYSDNFAGSDNSATGIAMADEVLLYGNPQATAPNSDLAKLLDALDACVATGDSAAAERLSEAFSGASAAAMGAALAGTVESRLESIRNRTTTMGVNQCVVNEDMPYFNAWINAEGDYRELNSDGSMPGYKLSSWGGTVGFDVDCTPSFTCGLAFSALYGNFDSKGADHATGDLNTYYLTAFARYAKHRWTHTFVATAGLADTSLERTVNGAKVEGDSDGSMLGALYEVGYVFALDEEATTCLQPVFNVAVTHSTLKGYTESGSTVALQVDDTELTRVSFGLGARLQAVVGESVYNRSSILEMRALLKADAGDREGETKVALAGTELPTHSVKSAESGAIGCELGAGLTVPVGDEGGNLFADASVELRADYTNVNATLGYRVNF